MARNSLKLRRARVTPRGMKRKPMLTKREKKTLEPPRTPRTRPVAAQAGGQGHQHIHCIACGRHIDASELSGAVPKARVLTCQHGSQFASCVGCVEGSQRLIDEHDALNQPVKAAAAWH